MYAMYVTRNERRLEGVWRGRGMGLERKVGNEGG
jgi:hypothetical protein